MLAETFIIMFKKYFFYFIIIFLLCLTACIQFKNNDEGIWFYTFSSKGTSSEYNLTPASFLCLQPDKNYTLDFGNFEYGQWDRNGDTIILSNTSGDRKALLIQSKTGSNVILSTEPGVSCDFEAQPYSFKEIAAQPFSLQNNKWRIKASRKESADEIRARLKNHCSFWKTYFTWAFDNNINNIDVRSTPTPIKIYGNGFALKPYDELPAEWKNYFFDSTDCKLASDVLENVFTHNDIAWGHTDNKYKMFIGAFEQLEQILNKK